MKIALCLITEGDSKLESLKGAVKSAVEAVDSVYITVNKRPFDKTKAWCKTMGYNFSYHEWKDDFADQRNFNFNQVPKNYDWILWMDSDDLIIGADRLRGIAKIAQAKGFETLYFDYWYGNKFDGKPSLETFVENELAQKRERLIKLGVSTWKKRIHESPVPLDGEHFKYSKIEYSKDMPVVWLHLGADRDMSKEQMDEKMARNRRLLELELMDERTNGGEADPRTLLYLMKIYAESEDKELLKKCVEMGDEYIQKSGWDMERAECYRLMAKCMGTLGMNEDARDFLHNAIKEYPYDPLLYLYLARAYFNLKNYRAMKHWMTLGLNIKMEDANSGFDNILELKVLSTELMLEYYLNAEKSMRKAYEVAVRLNKVNPTKNNQENEDYLFKLKELDEACENIHKYMMFLIKNKMEYLIEEVYNDLPDNIKVLPFAINYYNKYRTPKVWGDKEICYFANFGQGHFEKWDGNSITKGIGGSETAVIKLSEEWVKQGYKVVVYGDPIKDVVVNGVIYLPYYRFNVRDFFNIFIQWRHNMMADKVNAKKFYVDMHDLYVPETFEAKIDNVDKMFVKSAYHRELAPKIPDEKFAVISNGI
jgi:tetratricopeptide (TPR) repeat protein